MGCFSMPKGVPKKQYSGEFKQMVVETMMREKLSYREAARQFEVRDHKDVAKWERYYLAEVQRLRAENAYLKKLQALVLERERHQKKK